jgi:hypothetical protein
MANTTCSRLEEIAKATRTDLLVKNIYQDQSGLKYDQTHPNATQAMGAIDDPVNAKGKGTGGSFDTNNGGSSVDINGLPSVIGSGRNAIFSVNQYTPDNKYDCFAQ